MRRSTSFLLVLFAAFCLLGQLEPAHAAITTTGNVSPSYPGGDPWNVGGILYVARTADGTLTVDGGSDVTSTDGYIAHHRPPSRQTDSIVPDFPVINKSFNLSYSGNDL